MLIRVSLFTDRSCFDLRCLQDDVSFVVFDVDNQIANLSFQLFLQGFDKSNSVSGAYFAGSQYFAHLRHSCQLCGLFPEIEILDPKVVCTLGKDAAKALVDTGIELSWGEAYSIFGRAVFQTFSPGQFSKVTDELRVKHFRKLKKIVDRS